MNLITAKIEKSTRYKGKKADHSDDAIGRGSGKLT